MSSSDTPLSLTEHNLLIARLGLKLGLFNERVVKNAFTLWSCDRIQKLENILVEMKAITPAQRDQLSEEFFKWKSEKGGNTGFKSTPSDLMALENILEFLNDSDIQNSISSLQTQVIAPTPPQTTLRVEYISPSDKETPPSTDRFIRKGLLANQGGMGEIWIAIDRELNRDVIVKYIKDERSKDSQHRGMFHLEGEVTGFLEHPNIPPIYSLGTDSSKRNFYAMRYYKGKKLTKAIAEYHHLPLWETGLRREALIDLLNSFISACQAVEYAHSRGVIHCDIKPDNVILGNFGETIVLDWGLVVITQPTGNPQIDLFTESGIPDQARGYSPSKFAEEGLHTKQGGSRNYMGGTLAYMAPEQLVASETGEIDRVNKQSDVYCLGSTLYHICTGRAPLVPIKKKEEKKDSYFQRIKTGQFPKPRLLLNEIPKSLEAIILKAMAVKPADRYANPKALAEDIKHYLADEPVDAFPENSLTKFNRWARRNREKVGLSLLIFFLCLATGTFFVWREKQKTYANLQKAQEIGQSLMKLMKESETVFAGDSGISPERKSVYLSTAKAFKSFVGEFPNDVPLLSTFADVSRYLGNAERFDNRIKEALDHYNDAVKALEKLQEIDQKNKEDYQFQLCGSFREMAGCYAALEKTEDAKKYLDQALAIPNAFLKGAPSNSKFKREKALIESELANILMDQGQFAQAETMAQEATTLFADLKKNPTGNTAYPFDILFEGTALTKVAAAQRFLNRLTDAEKTHEKSLDLLRPMVKTLLATPGVTYIGATQQDILSQTNECLGERANTWVLLNKPAIEIEKQYQMVITQWNNLIKMTPNIPHYRGGLANILIHFGEWKTKQNQKDAKETLEKAIDTLEKLVADYPQIPGYKSDLDKAKKLLNP